MVGCTTAVARPDNFTLTEGCPWAAFLLFWLPMALSSRQLSLYQHTVNIWRETESFGADGKPGAMAWTQQTTNTACYCDFGESQMVPEAGVLLVESDNQFSIDTFHFEQSVDLRAGDILKMTSAPESGKFWTVRGNDQPKTRRANKLSVKASRTPSAPNGVT